LGGGAVAGGSAGAAGAGWQARAAQIAAIEAAQQAAVTAAAPASAVRQLVRLKGVATTSAAVLLEEGLLWRESLQPAPDCRPAGLCADAVCQWRVRARARDLEPPFMFWLP
jgi:hypothetical protein